MSEVLFSSTYSNYKYECLGIVYQVLTFTSYLKCIFYEIKFISGGEVWAGGSDMYK